jgi:phosphatidylcholine synthase
LNEQAVRALAFSIHVLTACGAALALLALLAATRGDWPLMFLLLGAALIVDAVDGPLARRFRIKELLPRWSGDVLDLVVDFTTYVVVPAYAMATAKLMPDALAVAAGIVIVVTSALYFADRDMKTADNHFQGFPAVWNLIAFYLLLLRPPSWLAAATVAAFAVLTFLPVCFVHPLRVVRCRPLTVALMAAWAVLSFVAVLQALAPDLWVVAALCLIAGYFLVIGLLPSRGSPT